MNPVKDDLNDTDSNTLSETDSELDLGIGEDEGTTQDNVNDF